MQSTYLMKPKALTPDNYYKVYVLDDTFIFAKMGGQLYEQNLFERDHLVLTLIFWLFRNKLLAKRKTSREATMDHAVEHDLDNLLLNKRHFKIEKKQIKSIEVSAKSTFHTGWNDHGSVVMTMEEGKKMRWIIPKSVSSSTVIELLNNQDIPLRVLNSKD